VNGRYTAACRQLYYKDIEAILVTHTHTALLLGIVCFIVSLVFGILAFSYSRGGAFWPLLIVCIISALGMIFQIYTRGSSVFGVKTAVQTVIITGLNTRRRVERAEDMLANKIESVQGRLSIDDLRSAIELAREEERAKAAEKIPKISTPPPIIQKPSEAERELNPEPSE
jgi:TM2 domain-containing membrane protein YozV